MRYCLSSLSLWQDFLSLKGFNESLDPEVLGNLLNLICPATRSQLKLNLTSPIKSPSSLISNDEGIHSERAPVRTCPTSELCASTRIGTGCDCDQQKYPEHWRTPGSEPFDSLDLRMSFRNYQVTGNNVLFFPELLSEFDRKLICSGNISACSIAWALWVHLKLQVCCPNFVNNYYAKETSCWYTFEGIGWTRPNSTRREWGPATYGHLW